MCWIKTIVIFDPFISLLDRFEEQQTVYNSNLKLVVKVDLKKCIKCSQ